MPRSFTVDEIALALSLSVNHHLFVSVADADGVMQDCSNLGDLHLDMLDGTTFGEGLDTPVSTGTLIIRRDTSFDSAAPLVGASSINRNALGAYAPLFQQGRAIAMRYAITAPGVAPTSDQIRPLFVGRIDAVHAHDNPMTIDISDIGSWLADAQLREAKQYADSTGVPGVGPLLGTMIQSMIDDAMPDSGVTLYEPVTSPFQPFSDSPQEPGSLLSAARNWALEIGWDLRYRWNDADEFVLTLFEPPRDKTDPDWTVGPAHYTKVNNLSSSIADVRNDIVVQYKDESGVLQTVESRNEASITKYGGPGAVPRLWFIPTSAIRNATDAQGLADAVDSDLSEPEVDQEIELPFFPYVQIGDLGLFQANDDHYDSDQLLAVVGYQHRFQDGEGITTIQVRGKVAGAYRAWIRRPGAAPGIPATPAVARPSLTPFLHDDTHAVDVVVDVAPLVTHIKVLASGTHLPSAAEVRATALIATGGALRLTVFSVISVLTEGATGYISALAYNSTGNESPLASTTVSLPTIASEEPPNIVMTKSTPDPITGLTVDVALRLTSPRGLGGTLYVSTAHSSVTSPLSTDPFEGSLIIAATPTYATEADAFRVEPSHVGTAQYLNDIRVHPTKGKLIFAEFINSEGTSSGLISFVLNGGGGVVDDNGNLKDASINLASQVANSMTLPSVYDTLPTSGRPNELALLTTDKKLYRWTGTAWTAAVATADLTGTVSATQITDHIISLQKLTTDLAPPIILSSLATASVGNQTALYNGELYRSNGSGGWTKAIATVDLTGTITGAQVAPSVIDTSKLAPGAVTSTKIASGLTVPQVVASIGAADPAVSLLAYNTSDGYFYRWIGSWTKTVNAPDITGQITSTQITDGAILTPKLAANAVTATQIAAGAVTAGKLDVGAVTAGTVAAGAIGTTELAANAVTAGKILAGAITADKLLVVARGAALNPDPTCADPSAWQNDAIGGAPPPSFVVGGIGWPGGNSAIITPASFQAYIRGKQLISIDPNKTYRLHAWIYRTAAANGILYLGVLAYKNDGSTEDTYYTTSSVVPPADGWTEYIGYIGPNRTNDVGQSMDMRGAQKSLVRMYALLNYLGTAGAYYLQDFRLEEVAPSTLIQDGAIITDKIATNAITSGKVSAGAITTDKLLITGGVGAALNPDPQTRDTSAWNLGESGYPAAVTLIGTAGKTGGYTIRSAVGNWGYISSIGYMAIDPTKVYRLHAWIRRTADAPGVYYLGVRGYDADTVPVNINAGLMYTGQSGNAPTANTWTLWEWYYTVGGTGGPPAATTFMPSNTQKLQIISLMNYSAVGQAGYYEIQDFRLEEAIPDTLIQDGVITTPKVVANALNGDRITSNTLDANKIVAGSITTDRFTANTISGTIITSETLAATKIIAGSITTDRMTANSINGDRITGGTLSAQKITTGTLAALTATVDAVTAGVLSAGAITATAIHAGSISTGHIATITLAETAPNAGIIQIGKLRSVDGTRYLDLGATGANPFLTHPNFTLYANGSAVFTGSITGASGNFSGTLSGASISGATGNFSGTLSGASISGATGNFTGTLSGATITGATGTFSGSLSGANISGATGTFTGALSGATGTFAGALTAANVQLTGVDPSNGTIIQITAADLAVGAKISFYNTISGYEAQLYSSGYFTNLVSPGGLVLESPATVQVQSTGGTLFLIGTAQVQIRGGSGSQAVLVVNSYDSAAAFVVTKSDGTILLQIDEPTNNQDTGLSMRYRDSSGVYSLKRMGSDTANSGGTGTRRLRIPN